MSNMKTRKLPEQPCIKEVRPHKGHMKL